MPDDNFQDPAPIYTFQGNSSAEELLDIARRHHEQARQLFDRALAAFAEHRPEEADLLRDLGLAQRKRADEFERAARGEIGDPIVTEILDMQQDIREKSSSSYAYTPEFISKDDQFKVELPKHMQPPPPGRIARAMAWISRKHH